MKLLKTLALLAVVGASVLSTRAEAPFQLALWAPEPQLVPATEDVKGVRLQIYGENRNVTGVDIGFVHRTTGDFVGLGGVFTLYNHVLGSTTGVQWGALNIAEGEVRGWQNGWVNFSMGKVTGLQSSFVNWNHIFSADVQGAQVGFVNLAKHVHGVQFGFVNYASSLKGVQIGLWNQVDSRDWDHFEPLPKVFPIINVGF